MTIEDAQVKYDREFYSINFRIRDRYFTALINTGDTSRLFTLPKNLFYDNISEELVNGGKTIEVQAHASKCLMLVGKTPFAIAGSRGHFFSGTEIDNIYLSGNEVEIAWTAGILNEVTVYLKVPTDYRVESINKSGNFRRIERADFSIIEVEKHKL